MRIDLHNHTMYSDGVDTPEELVLRAKENNIDIFAITDHDTVLGCEEVYNMGLKHGVKVVKGFELSVEYKGEMVHIVCLFKNNKVDESIIEFSKMKKENREKRAIKMLENIRDMFGMKIDIESLIKESELITRSNMMKHIMKLNNISYEEASSYTSRESKAYVSALKISVPDGLKLAHNANTICILAHPCLIKNQSYVEEILEYGFDGIEVRYPSEKNDEEYFRSLAKKYNLLCSAGSDCHGDFTHSNIGTCTLNEEEFKPIKEKLGL